MTDLADLPVLDKHRIIGAGCTRLRVAVDAERIRREVAALPDSMWGSKGGRGGVHNRAEAIWLRGHAPAEKRWPIEERDPFRLLPTLRELVMVTIPAPPMRCLLARLAAGSQVPAHADSGEYFVRTLRLHVPVITNPGVKMFADGRVYAMHPGEVWALDNSGIHGVINDDPRQARTHMIVDYLPSPGLLDLLAAADRGLGLEDAAVTRRFEEAYLAGAGPPGAGQ